jgi:transcriptional regulator with AAA-type ATPase domain
LIPTGEQSGLLIGTATMESVSLCGRMKSWSSNRRFALATNWLENHVYEQANQNQRRTAKLLGISRSTLARHLRGGCKNKAQLA